MPAPVYEIAAGGPYRRVARALRLGDRGRGDWVRRAIAVAALCYAPLAIAAAVRLALDGAWPPALAQLSTHVRALVAVPLLIAAETLVDARARTATRYMVDSGILANRSVREAYVAAIARTTRLRDSMGCELALLLVATTSVVLGGAHAGAAEPLVASAPATIVFRFLALRWFWRWLVWGVLLRRMARIGLALRATHPDRLAGLGPLLGPAYALGTVAAAGACTLTGTWTDQVLQEGIAPRAFADTAILYAFLAVIIALLPTCVFVLSLYRARCAGLATFGAFAHRFVYAFEEQWNDRPGGDALGAPDISSLADLGGSYTVVAEMKVVPWSRRLVLELVAASFAPMLPLVVLELGLAKLVEQLGAALL